jgi:lipid-binding SYLF domain-containing protein
MNPLLRLSGVLLFIAAAAACTTPSTDGSNVASLKASSLDRDARVALNSLYERTPAARSLGTNSAAILVFPRVTKAGLVVGAQGGDGVLIKDGRTIGYFNTGGVSVGLQAGAQEYGYALFFMSEEALKYLASSRGWEIGVGPSVVVVDAGAARTLTTTTAHSDIYAFIFDQKGLMAGMGLQGTKITQLR